jgi:hypothetical protein
LGIYFVVEKFRKIIEIVGGFSLESYTAAADSKDKDT